MAYTKKKPKVSTGGDKNKRRRERQKLGLLRDLDVRPTTKKRYEEAVAKFFQWASRRHISLNVSMAALDESLSDYIEHVWESGDPRGWATDAYSGLLKFVPRLRGECKESRRLINTWDRNELPNRAPPILEDEVWAMAGYAAKALDLEFAAACFLGFLGVLRTGEILNLTKAAVELNSEQKSMVLSLGLTKSAQRSGLEEQVIVESEAAYILVAAICADKLPGDYLFATSEYDFRQKFDDNKRCIVLLKLSLHLREHNFVQ